MINAKTTKNKSIQSLKRRKKVFGSEKDAFYRKYTFDLPISSSFKACEKMILKYLPTIIHYYALSLNQNTDG
jgi:hypothetical protein